MIMGSLRTHFPGRTLNSALVHSGHHVVGMMKKGRKEGYQLSRIARMRASERASEAGAASRQLGRRETEAGWAEHIGQIGEGET